MGHVVVTPPRNTTPQASLRIGKRHDPECDFLAPRAASGAHHGVLPAEMPLAPQSTLESQATTQTGPQ